MAKFSERLRQLRTARDLSQMEFAKQIKISKSSVNMYERGEREPGLETLEKIADYFNVDMDYLLGKADVVRRSSWPSFPLNDFSDSTFSSDNIIRIAGRDGSYRERHLTDEQMAALKAILDQMPEMPEDL